MHFSERAESSSYIRGSQKVLSPRIAPPGTDNGLLDRFQPAIPDGGTFALPRGLSGKESIGRAVRLLWLPDSLDARISIQGFSVDSDYFMRIGSVLLG